MNSLCSNPVLRVKYNCQLCMVKQALWEKFLSLKRMIDTAVALSPQEKSWEMKDLRKWRSYAPSRGLTLVQQVATKGAGVLLTCENVFRLHMHLDFYRVLGCVGDLSTDVSHFSDAHGGKEVCALHAGQGGNASLLRGAGEATVSEWAKHHRQVG